MSAVTSTTERFIDGLLAVPWLGTAGQVVENGVTRRTIAEGINADITCWSWHTHEIERAAIESIGDAYISAVFDFTACTLQNRLWEAVPQYFERRSTDQPDYDPMGIDGGLVAEMMDAIKRDIAWAAIESELGSAGFFTHLLTWYKLGRWPFSGSGRFPNVTIIYL